MPLRLLTPAGGTMPAFVVRATVAVLLSILDLALVVTLVVVALHHEDDARLAFGWFYQAVVALAVTVSLRFVWRWALAASPRPRAEVLPTDDDPPPQPHQSLTGAVELPRRW
jgi:ABC-type uncharacterized transport system permease subunit